LSVFSLAAGIVLASVFATTLPGSKATSTTTAKSLYPVLSAPDSIWNTPVAANAGIDSRSSALVAALTQSAAAGGTYPNTTKYSAPLYVVGPTQPLVHVIQDDGPWGASLQKVLDQGVPIPPNAKPAVGTDSTLVIDQPSTNKLWDFWQASTPAQNAPGAGPLPWKVPTPSYGDSQWHVSWGGAMDNVSESPGYFDDNSWPGESKTGWGDSASSLQWVAGMPLISEMKAGQINHAVGLQLASTLICAPTDNTWPAQRNDGHSTSSNCVPEGAHLRIDPSLNLSTLHLSPLALMIAKAGQKYGFIVHDGDGVTGESFQLEDPAQYGTNPYTSSGGLFGGLPAYKIFANFPWSKTQILTMNWHTSNHTITSTTAAVATSTSITAGSSVVVNTKVTRADGSPAWGAVYLEQGGVIRDMALLTGGKTTLSTPLTATDKHNLTVVYGGDENALASTSVALKVLVNAPPPSEPVLSAPNSIWHTVVSGSTTTIDPKSSAMVTALAQSASKGTYPVTTPYSYPLYIAAAAQARVHVTLDNPAVWKDSLQQVLDLGVPIPAGAQPAVGTDGILVIDQPSTNSLWELWRVSTPGQNAPGAPALPWSDPSHGDSKWHAVWGGAMDDVSQSPGYFDDTSWPGESKSGWGSSASSLVEVAGMPLISEMEAGQINHAVGISLPSTLICASVDNAWPAQRDDGSSKASNCIPEGAHLRINPSLNLNTLHLTPLALMLAQAGQKYGFIVHDGNGPTGEPAIPLENPSQYATNPYTSNGGLFGGLPGYKVLANFPWAQTQVLKMDVRTNHTTHTTTTTAHAVSSSLTSGSSVAVNAKVTLANGSPALGAVYLEQNGTIMNMAMLSGGTTKLSSPLTNPGMHTLSVVYGGDENGKSSTSVPMTVTVTK